MKSTEKWTGFEILVQTIKDHRLVAWILAVGIVLGSVLFFFARKSAKKTTPPFDARIEVTVQFQQPMFWIINDDGDFTACPAPLPIFIAITDLQSNPATISEITVDALDQNNKWVKLPQILRPGWHLYMNPDPARVRQVDTKIMSDLIQGAPIQPNVPLRGWMFFEKPVPYQMNEFRVTVKDTSGGQSISGPLAVRHTNPDVTSIVLRDKIVDVTKHVVDFHCDKPLPRR